MREQQILRIKLLKTLLELEEGVLNVFEQVQKSKSNPNENLMLDLTQPPTNVSMKEVFTVTDLSSYLGVSKDSVYTMVRERQIPFLRVRRRIIFHRQAIELWLKSGLTKP